MYKSALASLAQARKLRPVFVQRKSVADQIAWMHKTLKLRGSDTVAEHLLQVWFMKFQQPLLIKFCDGMGIEHNGEGSVDGALPPELDPEKLSETVDALYSEFNPRIVSLYLHLFNLQRTGGWGALEKVLSNDARVRLGAEVDPSSDESEPDSDSAGEMAGEGDAVVQKEPSGTSESRGEDEREAEEVPAQE